MNTAQPLLEAVPASSPRSERSPGGLPALAIISLICGIISGVVCGAFRLFLDYADGWRDGFLAWAHGFGWLGLPMVVAVFSAAVAISAWLVHRFAPFASGSGIPHVEKVLDGQVTPSPPSLVVVKFIGGVLALGAGLALGREGPSVQMGATCGHILGQVFRRTREDNLLLLAAGAGSGLAVAFNAPIAGAAFVLEELVRRFDTRTTIVTFGASAGAIGIGRLLFGSAPDFHVDPLPYAGYGCVAGSLVLGAALGLAGIAYNRTILGAMTLAGRLGRWPVELRAAAVAAVVGLLGWLEPKLIGGGDVLTQEALMGIQGGWIVLGIFLLRFVLGPASYATNVPGGLFAPLLVLGAQGGLLFGIICHGWLPDIAVTPVAWAVVGTAAFFTAVVRAPLTGIILAIELTGSYTQLLPMLGACFMAMLVPTLLGDPPIYEALKKR